MNDNNYIFHKSEIDNNNIELLNRISVKSGLPKKYVFNFLLEIYKNLENNLSAPYLFLLLKDPHLYKLQVIDEEFRQTANTNEAPVSKFEFKQLLDRIENLENYLVSSNDDIKIAVNQNTGFDFSEEEIQQIKANKAYRG